MDELRRLELLDRVKRGEKLNDTQAAELALATKARAARSPTLETRMTLLVLHLLALGVLGLTIWLVPVTVYRCEAQGVGRATCRIEATTAGWSVQSTQTVANVARAETTAARDAVRFYDARDKSIHEGDTAVVVGSRMTTIARNVQSLALGARTDPVVARQWPLFFAVIALLALLFLLAGGVSLLARRHTRTPGGADVGLTVAFALGATLVGFFLLWVAPVVSYACRATEVGAACAIEQRLVGLVEIDRAEIDGIASASGRSWTNRWTTRSKGRTEQHSKTLSEIELTAPQGRVLYSDTQSGAIGARVEDVAGRINALATGGAREPFVVWQMPWLPGVFASIFLLIGLPTLFALGVRAVPALARFAPALGIGVVLATGVGWMLALLGRFPG